MKHGKHLDLENHPLIVIKYGGNAMVDEARQQAFAKDVVALWQAGMKVVVVHGGGPQVDELLEKINHPSQRIDGMRVTDAVTLQIAEMVLTGGVGKALVNHIHQAGGLAVGLNGKDGQLLIAHKLTAEVDLGFVGQIDSVNPNVLFSLLEAGFIPVIAPIAGSTDGTSYNINADLAAGAIAKALNADEFLLLSNIDGVLDKNGVLLSELSTADIDALIKDGTIYGGMIPKLAGAVEAINAGLDSVTILNGMKDNACSQKLSGANIGTRISRH
ncbi:MAG: acetylglutamate kinase [Moraxella sp.]|nr:acetylglutamate kinase [Moraxella sp.]